MWHIFLAAVAEGLLSAHVGGIAGMRRAPSMFRDEASSGRLDDASLGLFEGDLAEGDYTGRQASFSRSYMDANGRDVFSRLGGGEARNGGGSSAMQMETDNVHMRSRGHY